ncbi:4Fe-4S binding protein [Vulcanisaeta souniana]|uniref:4Fe-4S binding protein n=1 Tax=Vulcanisaeta souniana TaxID=164452 RepID=UPI000A941EEB|nr:4Fe-4S binding protein [Vulcanisaeta souniana]
MGRVAKVIEKNVPTYLESACRARFGCSECVNACPVNAISIVNNKVTINESTCIECGLCVSKCPTGALAMVGADDNEYVALLNKLNTVKSIKKVTFTCPLNTRNLGTASTSIKCHVLMQLDLNGWQWRLSSPLR